MADGDLVATGLSKWGGKCVECRRPIQIGEPIWKLAAQGDTTQHGQGPGRWVCTPCAGPAIDRKHDDKRGKGNKDTKQPSNQEAFDLEAEPLSSNHA